MIESIHFYNYRKLKDIDISLTKNVNILSGTNGTCKSSILHIISNSFQTIKSNDTNLQDEKCVNIIRNINDQFNPKLETLTRGDKSFQDPAPGHKGPYYSVNYYNNYTTLAFRKHNSKKEIEGFRYAIKPQYKVNSNEKLPSAPVIYLGLSRLVTYGEYRDNKPLNKINKKLPQDYQDEICKIYKDFTGYDITSISNQHMGSIKIRADFESDIKGVDSNTISAGEDNLYIILSAILSLKYYYDNLIEHKDVDSVLLIDEFDATLHPAFQYKLFDIILEYSLTYNIQIVFTSHSLSLLEYCLKKKQNLVYLIDNINSAVPMSEPDIYKINMYLKSKTRQDIFSEKHIPIFTEDNEARFLVNILFSYYTEKYPEFKLIRNYFYLVDVNIGGDVLYSIFKDPKLKNFTGLFCILDGDKKEDISNRTIVLPGGKSPEVFLIEYAKKLYDNDSSFWLSDIVLEENMGKTFYLHTFLPEIDKMKSKLDNLKKNNKSISGVKRESTKKIFNDFKKFFQLLFECWLSDNINSTEVIRFYKNLNIMYKQVAAINGINPSLWNINE